MEFSKPMELVQRGTTAALLLDLQKHLADQCVEEILKQIDRVVVNNMLDTTLAVGFCHQIAAYRRMVDYNKQQVEQGRRASLRLATEDTANG